MALLAYSRPILVTKRSLLVLTIAVAAFLGQGSDAFASSTVHSSNTPGFSWVLLVSGDGADSVVNISRLGNTVTVTDTTGATAGTGCTQVNPTTSSCGVLSDETGQIFAQPGGGNDSVTLDQDMEYADATLEGAAGNDTLTGGAGRDLILPGAGSGQVMLGGPGTDVVSYADATGPVTADLDGVADDGPGTHTDQIGSDVEGLTGTTAADQLTGDGGPNTLQGVGGGDNIGGLGGDDYIVDGQGNGALGGGDGNDEVEIGSASGTDGDILDAGPGIDTVAYGNSTASVTASLAVVSASQGRTGENDGFLNAENLIGGRAADQLTGNGNDNTIASDERVSDPQAAQAGDTVACGAGTDTVVLGTGDNVDFASCENPATLTNSVPSFSVSDATVTEGNSGTANLTFTITRSNAFGNLRTEVSYETRGGTAAAGSDYRPVAGVARLAGGDTSVQVTVPVKGDTAAEAAETVELRLTGSIRSSVDDGTGIGTIENDDTPPPTLSIADASLGEGDSGEANMTFTITRSHTTGPAPTVQYATSDGTATAGSDYTATSDEATFAGASATTEITVPVTGDTASEPDETFTVTLSAPTDATLGDATAQGTIDNDDEPPPTISIADSSLTEGNSGQAGMLFTITRSSTAGNSTTTVNWATGDGTATAGSDYQAASGTATISGSATQTQITVPVNGDTADESDESLIVSLSSPANGTIGDGSALGTIFDDESPPTKSEPPGPPPADTTPPVTTASSKKTQRAGPSIVVTVGCSEDCTALARGKLTIGGAASAAKTYTVRSRPGAIQAGGRRTLKLAVSKKLLATIRRALAKHRKVSVRITVTARDAAGNAAKATRTVKLKR